MCRDLFEQLLATGGPEQQAIVDRLRLETATATAVRAAAEAELPAINALPAALLRRAFSGEL